MRIRETERHAREKQVQSAFNAGRIENNCEPDEEDISLWNKYIAGELSTKEIRNIFIEQAIKARYR